MSNYRYEVYFWTHTVAGGSGTEICGHRSRWTSIAHGLGYIFIVSPLITNLIAGTAWKRSEVARRHRFASCRPSELRIEAWKTEGADSRSVHGGYGSRVAYRTDATSLHRRVESCWTWRASICSYCRCVPGRTSFAMQ